MADAVVAEIFQRLAEALNETEENGAIWANQFDNVVNRQAHLETTAPEIWAQTEGKLNYFIAGYGTCGTISGVGRFLKEQNPDIKVIGVFPQKNHRIPGMKNFEESKKPGILDEDVVDESITVPDEPAYAMSIRLAPREPDRRPLHRRHCPGSAGIYQG